MQCKGSINDAISLLAGQEDQVTASGQESSSIERDDSDDERLYSSNKRRNRTLNRSKGPTKAGRVEKSPEPRRKHILKFKLNSHSSEELQRIAASIELPVSEAESGGYSSSCNSSVEWNDGSSFTGERSSSPDNASIIHEYLREKSESVPPPVLASDAPCSSQESISSLSQGQPRLKLILKPQHSGKSKLRRDSPERKVSAQERDLKRQAQKAALNQRIIDGFTTPPVDYIELTSRPNTPTPELAAPFRNIQI